MKKNIFFVFVLWGLSSLALAQSPLYLDPAAPVEARIDDLLPRLTTEEKVAMIHAQSKFSSPGAPRLGVPEFWMTDGPHGVRPEVLWDEWEQAGWTSDSCIAFPALTCLAATWNRELALRYGKAIGEEARYRKKDVLLAPGVNIYRTPLNGRNFEYMGEDPFLAGAMAAAYVAGVQQNGVAACVKHFALNNQETDRHRVDVVVDDRALHEIYLPAFKAAVQQGGAWAVMGSYNRYKGQHGCHNQYLLNDVLKRDWGFDGVVVSDWGGVHQTEEAIFNGLDLEFGTWTDGLSEGQSSAYNRYFLADPYLALIRSGKVGVKELDEKVRRLLRLAFRTTMNPARPLGSLGSPEHSDVARQVAEEGVVLLQNRRGLLPIDLSKTKKIAVVGENAIKMMTVGGGSSSLKAKYEIVPLDGLRRRAGDAVEIVYARGYVGDAGDAYNGVTTGQRLAADRSAAELVAEACRAARDADCVLFVGGLNKSEHQDCEGADRLSFDLPYEQNRLIAELARHNPNLVVVLVAGNAVAMPWADAAPAILQAWYLGSEAGHALAAILFGDVNPSGKLPFTFPVRLEDNAAHALGDFPGQHEQATYRESILVGYRWHDTRRIAPRFPFGHGLSYTEFTCGNAIADKKSMTADETITFSVAVKNTGPRDGAETVQLYIRDRQSSLPRPDKELKGFEKVFLKAGEERTLSFTVDRAALQYYDDAQGKWVAEPGVFDAWIGASSTDRKAQVTFELK